MPNRSDDPLRKVTLNLYEADCIWLEKIYGRGWTERIRQHIQMMVYERKLSIKPVPITLGDLTDEQ